LALVDRALTPRLSTGVIYPPEELERRNLIYNPDRGTLTPPPVEDYGFVEPAPGSNLEDQGPAVLEKAEGGSVEKKVKFVKEDDDDDVPDPPPGATPEEVADDIPAYLSTGEYVLPANVVRYIGLKNITGMHQRALSELQQMEDLDIIENVDENGYVEEDDDEMNYMKPEGVVEIVVAEHHPKGLMAMGFAEGGMINSDSSMEEGQVLPTSDIFSEGVYAQANINRSVDSEDVVESDKVITAPVAFSSAPGKTAYLAYITPEEAASLRQAKQGFSSEGNGQEVSDGQYQHLGPKGLMSFNGQGGFGGGDTGSGGSGSGRAADRAAAARAAAARAAAARAAARRPTAPRRRTARASRVAAPRRGPTARRPTAPRRRTARASPAATPRRAPPVRSATPPAASPTSRISSRATSHSPLASKRPRRRSPRSTRPSATSASRWLTGRATPGRKARRHRALNSAAVTRATTLAAPRSFPKKKKQIQILQKQQTQIL
jgi:hypothetical protein